MTTTLAVFTTDGRRHTLEATIASAVKNLHGSIGRRVIFTDAGNDAHVAWLKETFPFEVFCGPPKRGYAAAMKAAWRQLAIGAFDDHVFWLEDDFTFNRPVNVDHMARVLDRYNDIAQLALRRQPWNDQECVAGGIVESHPDWYTDVTDHDLRAHWLEQTAFWTNNPCLFRRELCSKVEWPQGANAEGRFTFEVLNACPGACFGFWGDRNSGEWVRHIGEERVGGGY